MKPRSAGHLYVSQRVRAHAEEVRFALIPLRRCESRGL